MNAERIKIQIIEWLLDGQLGFNKQNDSIGLEVLFSRNRRRADMLVVSHELHALEIKGDLDNLLKLSIQLPDYLTTFDRTSLVVTKKHLLKARANVPRQIGLILFDNEDVSVVRKAMPRKRIDKDSLLMFLRKGELGKLVGISGYGNYSTDELRFLASEKLSLNSIRQSVHETLQKRYGRRFKLFLQDLGMQVLADDLQSLYGDVGTLIG